MACVVVDVSDVSLSDDEQAVAPRASVVATTSGMMLRMTTEGECEERNATWFMHECWRRWRRGVSRIVQSRVVTFISVDQSTPVTAR